MAEDEQFTVEAVLGKKIEKKKSLYLIHWKGYSSRHDTWEPEENLHPDLITRFESSEGFSKKSKSKKHSKDKKSKKQTKKKHHHHHRRKDTERREKKRARAEEPDQVYPARVRTTKRRNVKSTYMSKPPPLSTQYPLTRFKVRLGQFLFYVPYNAQRPVNQLLKELQLRVARHPRLVGCKIDLAGLRLGSESGPQLPPLSSIKDVARAGDLIVGVLGEGTPQPTVWPDHPEITADRQEHG